MSGEEKEEQLDVGEVIIDEVETPILARIWLVNQWACWRPKKFPWVIAAPGGRRVAIQGLHESFQNHVDQARNNVHEKLSDRLQLANNVSPFQQRQALLTMLPVDILVLIYDYLGPNARSNFACVCQETSRAFTTWRDRTQSEEELPCWGHLLQTDLLYPTPATFHQFGLPPNLNREQTVFLKQLSEFTRLDRLKRAQIIAANPRVIDLGTLGPVGANQELLETLLPYCEAWAREARRWTACYHHVCVPPGMVSHFWNQAGVMIPPDEAVEIYFNCDVKRAARTPLPCEITNMPKFKRWVKSNADKGSIPDQLFAYSDSQPRVVVSMAMPCEPQNFIMFCFEVGEDQLFVGLFDESCAGVCPFCKKRHSLQV